MTKTASVVFLLISTITIITACSKGGNDEPAIDCNSVSKTWAADVNPLIQTYCNQPSCHDVASINGPGPLTNYNQVFSARTMIREAVASGLMPQNTTLNATQRAKIVCWIDSGAPDN
jgi:uncharacterized membrane protein